MLPEVSKSSFGNGMSAVVTVLLLCPIQEVIPRRYFFAEIEGKTLCSGIQHIAVHQTVGHQHRQSVSAPFARYAMTRFFSAPFRKIHGI